MNIVKDKDKKNEIVVEILRKIIIRGKIKIERKNIEV